MSSVSSEYNSGIYQDWRKPFFAEKFCLLLMYSLIIWLLKQSPLCFVCVCLLLSCSLYMRSLCVYGFLNISLCFLPRDLYSWFSTFLWESQTPYFSLSAEEDRNLCSCVPGLRWTTGAGRYLTFTYHSPWYIMNKYSKADL